MACEILGLAIQRSHGAPEILKTCVDAFKEIADLKDVQKAFHDAELSFSQVQKKPKICIGALSILNAFATVPSLQKNLTDLQLTETMLNACK